MGNESSQLIEDDEPAKTLKSRDLTSVAQHIKDGKVKKVVVMTGAGISTSAGIPDFRSPKTGLYSNLARLNLPTPEAVFDISFFRENPNPFYVLAKELYPGNYKPTVAHSFIYLLHKKGILRMLFTQNIDCLERVAGVPDEKVIEAHGSFATQRCIECKTEYPDDLMHEKVLNGEVPHCIVPQCNGLVKPDIVFFGEQLPDKFLNNRMDIPQDADLAIVMGTSLSVHPFASLPQFIREETPRLLFNLERVGDLGCRADDVCILGDCDSGVRKLADELGWREELEVEWRKVSGKAGEEPGVSVPKSRDEAVEAEVDKLTREIDESLKVSNSHTEWIRNGLAAADAKVNSVKNGVVTSKSSEDKVPAEQEAVPSNAKVQTAINSDTQAASVGNPLSSTTGASAVKQAEQTPLAKKESEVDPKL